VAPNMEAAAATAINVQMCNLIGPSFHRVAKERHPGLVRTVCSCMRASEQPESFVRIARGPGDRHLVGHLRYRRAVAPRRARRALDRQQGPDLGRVRRMPGELHILLDRLGEARLLS
jgi:hypothetical protein